MKRLGIMFLIPVFFLLTCKENKEADIKLGKVFDRSKLEISAETAVFAKNDKLAYVLEQEDSFSTGRISRRLYKGKEYVDMICTDSAEININPGTKKIGEDFPLFEIVQKYGIGEYMILFTINEKVIAKKQFSIVDAESTVMPKAPQPVINREIFDKTRKRTPVNVSAENSEAIEKKSNNQMTPKEMLKNMPSPGEMME